MFVLCIVCGISCGAAAWLLKFLIRTISTFLTHDTHALHANWLLWLWPTVGIFVAGWMQRRLFRRNVAHGTDRLKADLHKNNLILSGTEAVESITTCSVTIGCGGSAGAEGPIAFGGGVIGSNIAQLFGLKKQFIKMMMAFGAGAGIAAIFKAPLAGVFFVLEVLGVSIGTAELLGLVTGCLAGAGTAYTLDGFHRELVWSDAITQFDYSQFAWLIPIGILMGLYSLWYNCSGRALAKGLQGMTHDWMRNLSAGLALGVFVFCFPNLFGEGYGSLAHILAGDFSSILPYSPWSGMSGELVIPLVLAGILLVKGMAVYATNYGGGVAGSFAPTLFAGGMAGALIALILAQLGCHIPATQIAYICMGAAMGGIIGAPLMATFITVEITMTYSLLMPVATVVFIAYGTTVFAQKCVFDHRLFNHSKR